MAESLMNIFFTLNGIETESMSGLQKEGDIMEKCFCLKEFLPELVTNGRLAVFPTLDRKVVHVVLIKELEWPNRAKQEVFMCPFCKCFIFPGEKSKTKDGIKYHPQCPQRSNIGAINNKYLERKEQAHDGKIN